MTFLKFIGLMVCSSLLIGCSSNADHSDYQDAKEGSYQTPDKVPERAGRTKAEAGGSGQQAGRQEGG